MFSVVKVLEIDQTGENGSGEEECPEVLSEDSVSLEEPIILFEEWQDFSPSGKVENSKPK